MKKLLYIDYTFSPLASSWRGLAFAKYLPPLGWQPIILSAAESVSYDKEYSTLKEIPIETEIHRVGHYEPPRWLSLARRKLKIAADFPDPYKAWLRPAYQAARNILQREKIDVIYSVSPIFTTAFVAMRLRQEFDIPWVANFQDGWAVNDFLNAELDRSLIAPLRWWYKRRIRQAERQILQTADKIVVVHWHVKQRWADLYHIPEDKVTIVTNGYEEATFDGLMPRPAPSDKITISFLGTYYPAFEESIRTFLSVVNEIEPTAEVFFIGRGATAAYSLKQPNTVCILNLPRRKALSFAMGGDFVFVVMPPYARWTPTKLYEYMRMNKPILGLLPAEGDPARLIREAQAGFILSFDRAEMKQQLQDIFAQWRQGKFENFQSDQAYIAQFENSKNMEQIAQVLNQLVAERP
ncbi:MAG TPA: glycosyltransferase [Anaerolineae bacterium]|nr:glycosyltransferase [Anaerolineae bacterium]HQH37344.1 glycosyltransferase [Anaerolineae bacterium]